MIHVNQKKQQDSHKIAEITKKMGFCHISFFKQCFQFPKILVLFCVVCLKENKCDFWKSNKLKFDYNTATKMVKHTNEVKKIKIYMIHI